MTRPIVTLVYNTCVHVVRSRLQLIAALQAAGYEVIVVAPTDEATPWLAERGIVHHPITMSQYGMNPLAELRSIREIRGILEELRPVASLHYTIKPNTFGSMAAHQAGVPVLNNIAGAGRAFSGGNPVMKALVIQLYRFGLRRSHTVFFQNGDDMAVFRKAGLVRDAQCVRIPGSGVDLVRFTATPLPRGPIRFLFVGRLLWEKGVAEFLEAANAMLADAPDPDCLRFDLVGELEEDQGYISRADLERLTQAPQISYHGTVPPEKIDGMMRDTTCVVLPSYYGEGVPRVLLEACASGRPIITTDNVGCRDVVEDGVNGFKAPVRDTKALANAMRSMAQLSPDDRHRMALAARATAERKFNEDYVIEAYRRAIAAIAGQKLSP
jgi:glycosyltransferase involved in cell wall biosynthesis